MSPLEASLLVLIAVLAAGVATRPFRKRTPIAGLVLGLALLLPALLAVAVWRPPADSIPEAGSPQKTEDQGYVSSDHCRSCHPSQYASWHQSYHRTMTQVATPDAIQAPHRSTELEGGGRRFGVRFEDGGMWVDDVAQAAALRHVRTKGSPLPDGFPRVNEQVVMITGSHHMQIYWVPGQRGGLQQVSWAWLIRDQRWVPGEAVYLQPPPGLGGIHARWETNCIRCHATGGQPRLALGGRKPLPPDPRVGELGIGCESCHGPAVDHVELNHSPLRRYRQHLEDGPDPSIVNPKRLEADVSSEVCARCHSGHRHKDWDRNTGESFVPGERIGNYFRMRRYENTKPKDRPHYFWDDGTSRVTGREYTAMAESDCYTRGELQCGSCHSMHDSDPNDQLSATGLGDEACLQCHDGLRERIEEHTHHPASSSGSRCYNCHMPNTTYGILSVTRSHRIDSPSAEKSASTGRPNACNLCHLDRPLSWADEKLAAWYGGEATLAADDEATHTPAGPSWLLRGDAVQRAVAAWHLGWAPAREASGSDWQARLLVEALEDPYVAVRYLAERSLHEFPGYRDTGFDFAEDPSKQSTTLASLRDRAASGSRSSGPAALDDAAIDRLRAERDETPMTIWE